MSSNIKLAVSESSQLSVSVVVLACRAAHLCLLDRTSSTLPRENTLSPSLFCFAFFHFVLFHFHHPLCPSFWRFPCATSFFILPLFLFFESNTARCLVHFIFIGVLPCFPLSASLLFSFSTVTHCPFLFCIILGPLWQPLVTNLCHLCGGDVHHFSAPG